MASLFRSIRFGASSSHRKANMIRFNYLKKRAFTKDKETGEYRVDFDRMCMAMIDLSNEMLIMKSCMGLCKSKTND